VERSPIEFEKDDEADPRKSLVPVGERVVFGDAVTRT